jgi:hypothetical protein
LVLKGQKDHICDLAFEDAARKRHHSSMILGAIAANIYFVRTAHGRKQRRRPRLRGPRADDDLPWQLGGHR